MRQSAVQHPLSAPFWCFLSPPPDERRRGSGCKPTMAQCATGTWGTPREFFAFPMGLPPPHPPNSQSGPQQAVDMAGASCPHVTSWVGGQELAEQLPPAWC